MAGTENAANGARMSRRTFLTGSGAALILAAGGGLALARQFGADDDPQAGPGTPEVTATVNGQSSPTMTAAPRVDQAADGYLAVAPRTFRAGQAEAISLALFKGDKPANSTVTVALLKDGKAVAQAADWVPGRGSVALSVPKLAAGDYQLKISGKGFSDTGAITVEDNAILFLETDKPIYKPGQTMRIRLLALDAALRPVSGDATVAALDAKGIKVFKKTVTADDFGMASFDLPLSDEPNLGVWKLSATMAGGKQTAQRDVRVEKYVLPKYDVTVTLPKEWALASETLTGTVSAEYSFGKPVKGEVEIVAQRYVGTWQEYARITKPLDGSFSFELPAVRYVTGTPANGGGGGVRLDVTVREEGTGYEEQNSTLVTIVASPVGVRVVPETASFKPGLPLALLVTTETPDHQPVDASVALAVNYQDAKYQTRTETRQV
ncbi:MAG TPA: MG2 domain-containing protein, partial [Thermomicrobiales bacterium]|nr:MG2 domain-containing protein [Thermomicrobiales bacterium]